MAILFAGSSIADFVNGGSPATSVSSGNKYTHVLEAVTLNNSADTVAALLDTHYTELWLSAYVRNGSSSVTQAAHIGFMDLAFSASQPIFSMEFTGGSNPRPVVGRAYNGSAMVDLAAAAGSTDATSGVVRVDIHLKKDNTTGVFDIYINGSLVFTFSGDTDVHAGNAGANAVQFMQIGGGSSDTFVSAVIIADEDTRNMNLTQSWPTGAGGVAQWSGLYSDIDDQGFSDADAISTAGVNNISTYTKTTIPVAFNGGFTLEAVIVSARGKALSGRDVASAFRIGGVNYEEDAFGMDLTMGPKQVIIPLNPATGTAWTYTTANGAEVGVKLI